jgi:hypothetical protein
MIKRKTKGQIFLFSQGKLLPEKIIPWGGHSPHLWGEIAP